MYTVYCHIFPNGKRYVGITSTSVERRWHHGEGYKTCPLMDRAIRKYGWENVEHEILHTGLTQAEAEQAERDAIAAYRTTDPRYGYNVLPGGDVSDGITDEVRYKLGNGMRGKHHTEETKRKIGEAQKGQRVGEKHPMHGKSQSEEARARMSESHRRWWENASDRRKRISKPVVQCTMSGAPIRTWPSGSVVERVLGIHRTAISACCRGQKRSAGGYTWRFKDLP